MGSVGRDMDVTGKQKLSIRAASIRTAAPFSALSSQKEHKESGHNETVLMNVNGVHTQGSTLKSEFVEFCDKETQKIPCVYMFANLIVK